MGAKGLAEGLGVGTEGSCVAWSGHMGLGWGLRWARDRARDWAGSVVEEVGPDRLPEIRLEGGKYANVGF